MSASLINRISIALETISFFLVTLDLYGKDRLLTLSKKIINTNIEVVKHSNLVAKIVSIISLIIVVSGELIIRLPLQSKSVRKLFISWYQEHNILVVIVLIIGIFITIFKDKVEDFIRDKVFGNLISLGISLLSFFPIEGVMITIGTALFIISKILAFTNS
jgi:hypothetical protein